MLDESAPTDELETGIDDADDQDEGETEETSSADDQYQKMVAQAKKEAYDAVVAELAKGDTDTPMYKGLQKVVAKRDREVQELRQGLSIYQQNLEELSAQNRDVVEGINILFESLTEEIGEEGAKKLAEKVNSRQQRRLQEQVNQLQQQRVRQAAPVQNDDVSEQIAELKRQARADMEATVKEWGLDPATPGLDYGSDDEAFMVRARKLNTSIRELLNKKDEADTDAVRPKVTPTATRTSGGGSAPKGDAFGIDGKTLLERGADEWMGMMKKQTKATARR